MASEAFGAARRLSVEEAAFYDALAGVSTDGTPDPQLGDDRD